ncbi:MAG: beta-N-acetylhexosaminidase [Terriglobales bacterium]
MLRPGLLAALTALALLAGAAGAAQTPALVPYPRQVALQSGSFSLHSSARISVDGNQPADTFAAGLLRDELADIDHVRASVSHGHGGQVVLARAASATGRKWLHGAGLTLPPEAAAEGYALIVTPKQAAVVASSSAGIFYGVATLRQLLHPAGSSRRPEAVAPAVHIVDWPALRWRTLQMDLSRGPIPSLAAFERDLPLLAEFKINGLVLYFENTFAYSGQPLWAAPGGALDAAEAAQIVATAGKFHITVIPEQEAFGHLHLGLQAERYQDLLEAPYGHVLSPAVPQSLDLIGQMFAELASAFPSPFFHIGADETAELGTGRSAALQAQEGAGPLYLNYLKDIAARLQPYHRKILFWGDIAQRHPELLSQLPKDMIAVPWDYSPRPSFDRLIEPFTRAGLETWVAPGVSNWSRIFPDYAEATPNILNFVRDGRKLGATGLINTNWNDDGESFFDYCWYGVALGGAAGWERAPDLARFQNAYDWALYRADGHFFEQQIADLTRIHTTLEAAIHADGSDRLMWHQAFSPFGQDLYGRMEPAAHQVRLLAENVIASMAAHREAARRYPHLLDPVEFAARRFDFVGEKAIYAHYIAQLYAQASAPDASRGTVNSMLGRVNSINGLLQDMRDGATSLRSQYRTLWLESNTPYFLDNILLRYDAEAMYWEQQARRFTRISRTYAATGKLPPLVEADPN